MENAKTENLAAVIYYTDGLNKADFGGACADKSYQDESTVICRQLGYALDKFQYR